MDKDSPAEMLLFVVATSLAFYVIAFSFGLLGR